MYPVFRKARSVLILVYRWVVNIRRILFIRWGSDNISIPFSVSVGRGCEVKSTDGGRVVIGEKCFLGPNATIWAHTGLIEIGPESYIGHASMIVAHQEIRIGEQALIAEQVTIRDQDHRIDKPVPMSAAGFKVSPVEIGRDVWIGAKGSVLRGVSIGAGSVIGAHSLVNRDVPSGEIVAGSPARSIGSRI